ncbi:M20 family metallopeptidase [Arthrobacter rhombi]|uniref:M20 family metallopeptidase n=1 Tax=Arthrobacter rhombi TaxID=71253 RepID=UPI003FD30075
MSDPKVAARQAVDAALPQLVALSEDLYEHPEIAWQEVRSAELVATLLEEHGFAVTRDFVGVPNALKAVSGAGRRRIAVMAEYDALPHIGHACGHNLIAATSVGAALGLSRVADELDLKVELYGTPAEEGGGGKIEMLDRGAFEGVDFAMLAHPAPVDVVRAEPFAVSHSAVSYTGKAAHAAAYPSQGINAADAFIVAQVAIGQLRQQLPPTTRVHGVMTSGGEAPNAIPERTTGRWYVRASTLTELTEVQRKVENCFEAGALATGCELSFEPESQPYADFRAFEPGLEAYERNARALGRDLRTEGPETEMRRASTDMGNVSQVVRAIHPYIGVGSYPVLNHQKEFADHCVGPTANQALIDGAVALAWTGIDVADLL